MTLMIAQISSARIMRPIIPPYSDMCLPFRQRLRFCRESMSKSSERFARSDGLRCPRKRSAIHGTASSVADCYTGRPGAPTVEGSGVHELPSARSVVACGVTVDLPGTEQQVSVEEELHIPTRVPGVSSLNAQTEYRRAYYPACRVMLS